MSRVVERKLWADPSPSADVVGYNWYSGVPGDGAFLGAADAGSIAPLQTTTLPELILTEGLLPEGNYQFALVAEDGAGNTSDPYQHPVWADVPLDLTPPLPASGGGLV